MRGGEKEGGLERVGLSACGSGSPYPSRGRGGRAQWRGLNEVAVPFAAAPGWSVSGGHCGCPGAAFATVPLSLGVGSEGRKEPEVIPGSTNPSHPWKRWREE